MASVSMIKGTKSEIEATPRIDGQFLIETDQGDLNKIYTDTLIDGNVERTLAGGGGHLILPDPDPDDPEDTPTEALVVDAVNSATATSDRINSLYGTQQWSNEKNKRFIVEGAASDSMIGSSGIGTWIGEDDEVIQVTPVGNENPSSEGWYEIDFNNDPPIYILSTDTAVQPNKKYFSQVIDESDWLPLDILKTINADDSDDIGVSLKFDPKTNEPITLGGYIIDTDTGNMCIKFGNSISDTEHARVAIDITYTRNDYSVIS